MSFKETNRYFISSLMRLNALPELERQTCYQRDFYEAMHERAFSARRLVTDLNLLSDLYVDLFNTLENYDLDWLLSSLFFEENAEILIPALKPTFNKIGREKLSNSSFIEADLFLGEVDFHNGSIIKGYLKSFFIRWLEITEKDWQEEGDNSNPLINVLAAFMIDTITGKRDVMNLEVILIHFAKLWQVYYSNPFVSSKGNVLFHRLTTAYQQTNKKDLKLNLLSTLSTIEKKFSTLLYQIGEFPLILINKYNDNGPTPAYSNKKKIFFDMFKDDQVFFIDHSNLSLSQLFNECRNATNSVTEAYLEEINNRLTSGYLTSTEDLIILADLFNQSDGFTPKVKEALAKVMYKNYIYYC